MSYEALEREVESGGTGKRRWELLHCEALKSDNLQGERVVWSAVVRLLMQEKKMRANHWPVRVEERATRHGAETSGKNKNEPRPSRMTCEENRDLSCSRVQ